jgi:hypothetical protein
VFLSAHRFDGDLTQLVAARQRLLERFPLDGLDLPLGLTTDTCIVVLDACPSRAAHEEFSRSPQFRGAVTAAGPPTPPLKPLGEVYLAHLRERGTT